MKLNRKILFLSLVFIGLGIQNNVQACTNFIVSKGASKKGSTFITYAADSHTLYGELYYRKAATYPAGATFQVIDWDTGVPLAQIKQVAQTYSVVGNINEHQLAISETTYGGRKELEDATGGIDYGSLIYITLQRAKNAREAIKTMAELVETYGYFSGGESFSIADPEEVWILEMIGKGAPVKDAKGNVVKGWTKGAVWVALRIPDGYVSGHANHARITTFPLEAKKSFKSISSKNLKEIFRPEVECVYAHDVISFARLKKYYNGTDAEFSFSDTYAPISFSAARFSEARVWAGFRKVAEGMDIYTDYAMGKNLTNRMPLWVKPTRKLDVLDVADMMRDHYEGTPLDMTKDVGAGPFNNPYRWRPMEWSLNGKDYVHERAISTQQTGFSFVAECRGSFPAPIGGILWFGVDDTYTTVYAPMYCGILSAPHVFESGNGDMVTYSPTSAFWLFNQVTNFAYLRYKDMIVDVLKVQKELENTFVKRVDEMDKRAMEIKDEAQLRRELTQFSHDQANYMFKEWKTLSEYLLVKYIDGNIKKTDANGNFERNPYRKEQNEMPNMPKYPDWWYQLIIDNHGKTIQVPDGASSH